jgi:subtilase family serine protease
VRTTPLKVKLAAVFAASATVATLGVGAVSPAGASAPQPHRVIVKPLIHRVNINPNKVTFSCQSNPIDFSNGSPRCYQPSQIQRAYDVTPLLRDGKDGRGRTIVIVDAFDQPFIRTDLNIFNRTFDLKKANFHKIAPQGVPAFDINDANQVGWAEETTLDVLWAHAIAPGAKIELVQAKSNQDADILAATQFAIDHHLGDVLSQSFGEAEQCMDPAIASAQHRMFAQAKRQHWTVFASSGDSGAAQPACSGDGAVLAASTPASDPFVTGVGGTTLNANGVTGAYIGETAWTEVFGCNPPAVDVSDVNCSGGGFSTLFKKPDFQNGLVPGPARGVPDVAYNAGVNGGVLTHCAVCNLTIGLAPNDPTFFLFGGTSAGTPQWSAIAAIADQVAHHRVGDINPTLYRLARRPSSYAANFHDVTTGNNTVAELGGFGYRAGPGWDAVTGLGTPNAAHLVRRLAD